MPTPAPFRRALHGALGDVRYVRPVPPRSATGVVARVYAAAENEFGLLAPPVALHSPDPSVLAATWLLLRETLIATAGPQRAVKEAVAAGVSLANRCPYCVEVHGAVLGGVLGDRGRADAEAVAADRLEQVGDPVVRAVVAWARDGGPVPSFVPAAHVPQLLGTALAFHHLNRVVTVFLGPSPLPSVLPAVARRPARSLLGRVLRDTALADRVPGADLDLLPPAALPSDLSWAAGTGPLADALARVVAGVERAAGRVLGPGQDVLRDAVTAAVAEPDRPGVVADPAAPVVDAVARSDRSVARLAGLVALAPHRVDHTVVSGFRAAGARTDADLVAVVAWAALTAARARVTALTAALHGRSP